MANDLQDQAQAAPLSAAQAAPPELLGRIILQGMASPNTIHLTRLRLVSRSWNTGALVTPALWRRLVIDLDRLPGPNPRITEMGAAWLSRGGDSLILELIATKAVEDENGKALRKDASALQQHIATEVMNLVTHPQLDGRWIAWRFSVCHLSVGAEITNTMADNAAHVASAVSKLQSLNIGLVGFLWHRLSEHLDSEAYHLGHLCLKRCGASIAARPILTQSQPSTGFPTHIRSLHVCQNIYIRPVFLTYLPMLEELFIDQGSPGGTSRPSAPFVHPRLQYIHIRGHDSMVWWRDLIKAATLPALKALKFSNMGKFIVNERIPLKVMERLAEEIAQRSALKNLHLHLDILDTSMEHKFHLLNHLGGLRFTHLFFPDWFRLIHTEAGLRIISCLGEGGYMTHTESITCASSLAPMDEAMWLQVSLDAIASELYDPIKSERPIKFYINQKENVRKDTVVPEGLEICRLPPAEFKKWMEFGVKKVKV